MHINRRSFLLAAGCAVFARPALAGAIPLSELSRYFNGFETAQARFLHRNPDGSALRGTLHMRRPGRARFSYDAPENSLVIAGGSQVAIFDGRSNAGPNQYPLRSTPLGLILEKNVNLEDRRMVVAHGLHGGMTFVTLQDPERPQYGSIRLLFSAGPVALKGWIMRDDTGSETQITIEGMQYGMSLAASLFNISSESDRRRR